MAEFPRKKTGQLLPWTARYHRFMTGSAYGGDDSFIGCQEIRKNGVRWLKLNYVGPWRGTTTRHPRPLKKQIGLLAF